MRALLAAASICLASTAHSEPCPTALGDMLRTYRDAVVETMRGTLAEAFLAEFIKTAGDPPKQIKPSAVVVFSTKDGALAAQFFDAEGCMAFGAGFDPTFFQTIRNQVGFAI